MSCFYHLMERFRLQNPEEEKIPFVDKLQIA